MQTTADDGSEARLADAAQLEASGQVLQAELIYLAVLSARPGHPDAARGVARLSMARGDPRRAAQVLAGAVQAQPLDASLAVDMASAWLAADEPHLAIGVLRSGLQRAPDHAIGWLMLGELCAAMGDSGAALAAGFEAVTRARRAGEWQSPETTPPGLQAVVDQARARVKQGRRELFFGAYAALHHEHGSTALARVDRALAAYLGEIELRPDSPRQLPTFMYVPDLPPGPYHDPYLQPWAKALVAAYPAIRAEARQVMAEDQQLPDFVDVPDGRNMKDYVGGGGPQPAWEAFFFYRHGQRFDAHHARCQRTSALLESIELCRIADQAPEILFSVLRPGSHIMPHYGVCNARLVMHLPLFVPRDCALNVVGSGERHWREGELMMFDDTHLHEAWNRSDETRVILLMDCWNPHLTPVEKLAFKRLIETISALSVPKPQAAPAQP